MRDLTNCIDAVKEICELTQNAMENMDYTLADIAITILETQDSHLKAHDYVWTLDSRNQNTYEVQLQFYRNKYLDNIGKN